MTKYIKTLIIIMMVNNKKYILHINATTKGGGVAEILTRMKHYDDMKWIVPYENIKISYQTLDKFYRTTKRFHNLLQGDRGVVTEENTSIFEKVNSRAWTYIKKYIHKYSLIVIHDPQPAALIPKIKKAFPNIPIIWRCHIDLSSPNVSVWEYLVKFINHADVAIFHTEIFVPKSLTPIAIIMPPSIDPSSFKNCPLEEIPAPDMIKRIINLYKGEIFKNFVKKLSDKHVRIESLESAAKKIKTIKKNTSLEELVKHLHGIKDKESYILQVSRYDKFKDPTGVVESYIRFIKRAVPGSNIPNLIYAGELVDDDPEGTIIFKELTRSIVSLHKEHPQIAKKIKLLILPNWDKEANAIEVNILQRSALIVMQKSVAEGFALTVSEAMWKEKAVLGGNVGGIKKQIINDFNGYLVDSIYEAAEALDTLCSDENLITTMGKIGREIVKQKFILPIHYKNYKTLLYILTDPKMKTWLTSKKVADISELNSKLRKTLYLRRKNHFH